jgi:crotonobetainyl-CoA:carnitine CoA-transferase CaiB-like acyl-CoA transferase
MTENAAPAPQETPVDEQESEGNGPQPLGGLRVIDFSRVLAGPLCTMILGDLGADVIKVERPGTGDDTRTWGPPFADGDAAYFLALNRNKRSVEVDLATADGRRAARRLIDGADVVIENFRSGVMRDFDLDLDELRRDRPGLVTCTLTAFGDDPAERRPGYDIIMQALSGLMSVTGEPDGEPVKVGVALLDVIAGLYAAIGILAAISERDRTGHGRHVSVSLFGAAAAAMVNQASNFLIGGIVPTAMGTAHPNIVPYQAFRARDRSFILAAGNDRLFARMSEAVGRSELATDPRFATNEARVRERDALVPILQDVFSERDAAHWLTALEEAGVPCAPVRRLDEVFASQEGRAAVQQVAGLDLVADPIELDGERLAARRAPPKLGENTQEILGRSGED